jgi:hypothetical protein
LRFHASLPTRVTSRNDDDAGHGGTGRRRGERQPKKLAKSINN